MSDKNKGKLTLDETILYKAYLSLVDKYSSELRDDEYGQAKWNAIEDMADEMGISINEMREKIINIIAKLLGKDRSELPA